MTHTLAEKLIAQAGGDRTAEAAAIILTRSVGGRLMGSLALAWDGDTIAEIDWPTTRASTGYFSGGERRLLALADSLDTGQPVDLADVLTGLDETNARIVLQAFAHVLGIGQLEGGLR